jgi:hypothetical protein
VIVRKCGKCGFPRRFARYFDWRSDGTIIGTDRVKMQSRITFIERGELEGLFDDLSMMLGVTIDHILIEAEKNIGKAFYASTPLRFLRFAPLDQRFRPAWVARGAVRAVRADVAGLGSGVIRAESYDRDGAMLLRMKNPVFTARTVGNSVGIYESIERIRGVDYEYSIEGGDLLLMMRHPAHDSRPDDLAGTRLIFDEVVCGDGPVVFERCGQCGTPLMASAALEWDLPGGKIMNRLTGKRELVGAVQSVNAMLRELEAELGEDVLKPVYSCQKEITRAQLDRDAMGRGDDFWDRFLLGCAVRGLGFPSSIETAAQNVSVEISNPDNPVLYAARIAAALEYLTGLPSQIEWKTRLKEKNAFTLTAAG